MPPEKRFAVYIYKKTAPKDGFNIGKTGYRLENGPAGISGLA